MNQDPNSRFIKNFDSDLNGERNFNLVTGIGPMTDRLLNGILNRLTSRDNTEKMDSRFISPAIHLITSKLQPYIYIGIGLYSILILLLLVIIYLLIIKKH